MMSDKNSIFRTVSAPSSLLPARNTTLYYYQTPTVVPSIKSILGDQSIAEELLSPLCRSTIQVCFLFNCRIQEVLNARICDIVHPDRVVFHGLKRSSSYIVYLPGLSDQVSQWPDAVAETVIFPITYLKLYRAACRAGISHFIKGGANRRRLHSSRYLLAKKLVNQVDDKDMSDILRHRSASSLSYYQK